MANPRQKRKLRSSAPRAVQKPKKTTSKILGNAIIASNWDHKETLSQNYKRLGLAHRLRRAAGGTEKGLHGIEEESRKSKAAAGQSVEGTKEVKIRKGKVVGEEGERKEVVGAWGRLNDPLDSDEDDGWEGFDDELEAERFNTREHSRFDAHAAIGHLGSQWLDESEPTQDGGRVVQQLSQSAAAASRQRKNNKPTRTQSAREQAWLEALIEKHGDDYASMARDGKLNLRQQTAGDIRRRVRQYIGRA